jgi:uncharacterized protein (TIGR02594 family)
MYQRILGVVLAICSLAFVTAVSPALARSHHHRSHQSEAHKTHVTGSHRVAHRRSVGRSSSARHYAANTRRSGRHQFRRAASPQPTQQQAMAAAMTEDRFMVKSQDVMTSGGSSGSGNSRGNGGGSSAWSSSDIVAEARRYVGTNPTDRRSLWCARFMNFVLAHTGHVGTGSDMARSFARYGRRVSGPQIGAIAVMSRGRRGGHVGVVSGVDEHGNPIIISGNHGNRVAEAVYPRGRVYSYVMPGT